MKSRLYCSLLLTIALTAYGQAQETAPPSQQKRTPVIKPFLRKFSVALGTAGFLVSYFLYKQFRRTPHTNLSLLSPNLSDSREPILVLPFTAEMSPPTTNLPTDQVTSLAAQDPSPVVPAIPALPPNLTALARPPSPATVSHETPRSMASDSSSLGRNSFDSYGTQSDEDSPRPESPYPDSEEFIFFVEPAPQTSDLVLSDQPHDEALPTTVHNLVPPIPDIQPIFAQPPALSPQAMSDETPRPSPAHALTTARISQDTVGTTLVPAALHDSPRLDRDPVLKGFFAVVENCLRRPLKEEVRLPKQTSGSSLTPDASEKINPHRRESVIVFNERQLVIHFLTELVSTHHIPDHHRDHPLLKRIIGDEAFKNLCSALGVQKVEQPTAPHHHPNHPTLFHRILPLRRSKKESIPEMPLAKPIIKKTSSALEDAENSILDVVIAVQNNNVPVTELENILAHYGPLESGLIHALAQEFVPEEMRRGLIVKAVGYLLKEHNTLASLARHTDITDTEIYQSLFLTLQSSLDSSEQSLRHIQNQLAINNALMILSAQKPKLLSALARQKKELEDALHSSTRTRYKAALEFEVLRIFAYGTA